MCRAACGNSEVWILPVVGQLRKGLEWNRDYLSDLLDGANAILARPRPNVKYGGYRLVSCLTRGSELSLPRGQTLEAILPRICARVSWRRARRWPATKTITATTRRCAPASAWRRIVGQAAASGVAASPASTINSLARNRSGIERRPVRRFERDGRGARHPQAHATTAAGLPVTGRGSDVQWALAHADAAGRAWAVGDVKGMKAHFRESQGGNCVMAAVGRFAEIDARNISEFASAIEAALAKPGKTVVIIRLDQLLRKGAVLDRLKASGATIEAPAGEEVYWRRASPAANSAAMRSLEQHDKRNPSRPSTPHWPGNLAIAVTKAVAAALTASSVMMTEALHSLIDTGNEGLLLIGLRRAGRAPDESHPFGYGLEIYFWAFVVALLIFSLGGGLAVYQGVQHIRHPLTVTQPWINFVVLGLAFIFEALSFRVAWREFAKARRDVPVLTAISRSKDPALFSVLLEDGAALAGLILAGRRPGCHWSGWIGVGPMAPLR